MNPNAARVGRTLIRKSIAIPAARGFARILTRAGFLPPVVWKRLPVATTFDISLPQGKSIVYASIANDGIGRALYWRGLQAWEAETIFVFLRLAEQARTVVDIGANTGIYTLLACAASPHSRVIAFEPVPHIFERLTQNIRLNHFEHRCGVYNVALSNFDGVAHLHVPHGDLPTSASLNMHGFRGYSGYLVDIAVKKADSLLAGNTSIDLIKLDVEGFEDKVLEGMKRQLCISAPMLIVECNPDGPYKAVEAILSEFSYRFYGLVAGGPLAMDKIVPDQNGHYRNFLCIPERRLSALNL